MWQRRVLCKNNPPPAYCCDNCVYWITSNVSITYVFVQLKLQRLQATVEAERDRVTRLENEVATVQQRADGLAIELSGTLVCKDPGAGSVIISEMVGSKTLGWRRISSGHFRLACLLWMYLLLLVDVPFQCLPHRMSLRRSDSTPASWRARGRT